MEPLSTRYRLWTPILLSAALSARGTERETDVTKKKTKKQRRGPKPPRGDAIRIEHAIDLLEKDPALTVRAALALACLYFSPGMKRDKAVTALSQRLKTIDSNRGNLDELTGVEKSVLRSEVDRLAKSPLLKRFLRGRN